MIDWQAADRYLIGETWKGSDIDQYLQKLCIEIGPRWAEPQEWPENPNTPESVEQRLRDEVAQVVRVN